MTEKQTVFPSGPVAPECVSNDDELDHECTSWILFGDVTGDGKINSLDFVYIKRHVWSIRALEGPFLIAGSISSSDKSTASNTSSYDFVLIKRHVWNIKTIVQPQ